MTNEELQAHIKALNDALDAGEIEETSLTNEKWEKPAFGRIVVGRGLESEGYSLRIKPQPREVWIRDDEVPIQNCVADCDAHLFSAKPPLAYDPSKYRKFREVIE